MTDAPVALVFGTRPEAVKMAPVARALKARGVPTTLIVTAQHRGLLDQMLAVFELEADVDLNLMRANQRLSDFGGRALSALAECFQRHRPAMVLVQGDTSTVFFGALAAFYDEIPVGHVEAGLRSFDMRQPFPEEGNRKLTSQLARLHFAPTTQAKENLRAEGIADEAIYVTGNPVVDSLEFMAQVLADREPSPQLSPLLNTERRLVIVTAHRRENFGAPLTRIFAALRDIACARPDVDLVYPVHPNPKVKEPAAQLLAGVDNIHLLPPLDYLDFVALLRQSHLCLTDSGGLQEEAPSFGVPLLVLRETTERPEGVAAGCAELVGSVRAKIVERALAVLDEEPGQRQQVNPYGDGKAGQHIAAAVEAFLRSS